MKVTTNGIYRNLIDWHELTDKEKAEFDYLDTDGKQTEADFFRYKGNVYHLQDAMMVGDDSEWDGSYSETAFSGVFVKIGDSREYNAGKVLVGSAKW